MNFSRINLRRYFSVTWSEKDERFLMAHSCGIASLCLAFSRDGIYWMPWDYAEYVA